jgi:hypothetical protein
MFECEKCKKNFSTKSNLKRHLSKKNPCDQMQNFICSACNKEFFSKYNLQRHIKRKKPCVIIGEKQEIMHPERELEIYKEKKKIDMEYRMLEHKLELQLIQAKKEAYKEISAERKENNLAVEKAKTERKKHTAQIINNNMIQVNIQELKILNRHPPTDIIEATADCLNKITKYITYNTSDKNIIEIAFKNGDINNISIQLIKKTYNNNDYPDQKNMIYSDDSNTFYAVKDGEWQETEFESLKEIISMTLQNYYKKFCKKTKGLTMEDNEKAIIEQMKERQYFGYSKEELEDIAKKALILEIK